LSFGLNIARDIERAATNRNPGAPLIARATVKRAARKRWRLGQCVAGQCEAEEKN
jgi:hypothetical protein